MQEGTPVSFPKSTLCTFPDTLVTWNLPSEFSFWISSFLLFLIRSMQCRTTLRVTVTQEVRYVVIVWPVRSCHCVVLEKVFWYMSGRNVSMRMVITSESAICFRRGRYLYFKSLFWASTLMFVSTAAWYVASL